MIRDILEKISFVGLILLILATPIVLGAFSWWSLSTFGIIGVVIIFMALIAWVGTDIEIINPTWLIFAGLFVFWVWVSTLWSAYPLEAYRWSIFWTVAIGLAMCAHIFSANTQYRNIIVISFVLAAISAVVVAMFQEYKILLPFIQVIGGAGDLFLTGPYYHPSHYSGYLIGVSALLTSLIIFRRFDGWSLLLIVLQFFVQYTNFKTDGSSIPAVILAMLLPFLVYIWRYKWWLGMLSAIVGITGILAVVYVLLVPSGQNYLEQYRSQLGFKSSSVTSFVDCRKNVYATDNQMWNDHLVKGVGIGQFFWQSDQYLVVPAQTKCVFTAVNKVNYAHSDYYQVATELGVVGLVLFILMYLFSVLHGYRSPIELAWLSAYIAYFLVGFYDAHLTAIPATIVMMCIFSAVQAPKSETTWSEEAVSRR